MKSSSKNQTKSSSRKTEQSSDSSDINTSKDTTDQNHKIQKSSSKDQTKSSSRKTEQSSDSSDRNASKDIKDQNQRIQKDSKKESEKTPISKPDNNYDSESTSDSHEDEPRMVNGHMMYPALLKKANETLDIIKNSFYVNKTDKRYIRINTNFMTSHSKFISEKEHFKLPKLQGNSKLCKIEITHEKTYDAALRIKRQLKIKETVVLNFASATSPGGGWLNGRNAQEESITRQSTLYASLRMYKNQFYDKHSKLYSKHSLKRNLYTDSMIYSPNVTVIRDSRKEELLEKPFLVSVITCAAPNLKGLRNDYRNHFKYQKKKREERKKQEEDRKRQEERRRKEAVKRRKKDDEKKNQKEKSKKSSIKSFKPKTTPFIPESYDDDSNSESNSGIKDLNDNQNLPKTSDNIKDNDQQNQASEQGDEEDINENQNSDGINEDQLDGIKSAKVKNNKIIEYDNMAPKSQENTRKKIVLSKPSDNNNNNDNQVQSEQTNQSTDNHLNDPNSNSETKVEDIGNNNTEKGKQDASDSVNKSKEDSNNDDNSKESKNEEQKLADKSKDDTNNDKGESNASVVQNDESSNNSVEKEDKSDKIAKDDDNNEDSAESNSNSDNDDDDGDDDEKHEKDQTVEPKKKDSSPSKSAKSSSNNDDDDDSKKDGECRTAKSDSSDDDSNDGSKKDEEDEEKEKEKQALNLAIEENYQIMKNRIKKILMLAIDQGNKAIVLGAFGCGIFENDPKIVSEIFKTLLVDDRLGYYFDYVVFGITGSDDSKNYTSFVSTFKKYLKS